MIRQWASVHELDDSKRDSGFALAQESWYQALLTSLIECMMTRPAAALGIFVILDMQSGLPCVQREVKHFGWDVSRLIVHVQSVGAFLWS